MRALVSPEAAAAAKAAASSLTSDSVASVLGPWASTLMVLIVFVFAYSSLLGNFTYAEINVDFLRGSNKDHTWLRFMILVATAVGSMASLNFVWNLSDIAMGLMAIINIVAITLLGKWALGALRDWEAQNRAVRAGLQDEIVFVSTANPCMPGELPGDVWSLDGAAHAGAPAVREVVAEGAEVVR